MNDYSAARILAATQELDAAALAGPAPMTRQIPQEPKMTIFAQQNAWTLLDQTGSLVLHWKGHREKNPNVRQVSVTDHMISSSFIVTQVILQLRTLFQANKVTHYVDWFRLMMAWQIHDLAEIILKGDVDYARKNVERDAVEFTAFVPWLRKACIHETVIEQFEEAFLLQFALKQEHFSSFNARGRQILSRLNEESILEATIFSAAEALECFFYALECLRIHHVKGPLYQVAKDQQPRLEVFSKTIPHFDTVWTPKLNDWAKEVAAIGVAQPQT